ncbi:MAG: succinylglutamate desuccinylase/aspartoacylase family protein [Bacteroidota bacterium]
MAKSIVIHNTEVLPGEQAVIQLNVARLPSGTIINIGIHVFRTKHEGPTVLVMGGVHGDEINGVEIVRRLLDQGLFKKLKIGSVIAIPLLNVYGFINFSRDASEGKDVNRSFPGSLKGSLASRVAANVSRHVLPHIDFGVDFHTGGGSRYNYPQIRLSQGDKKAEVLARQFAAPYTIRKANIPKTLRKMAMGMKKPVLVYEGGEALRYDGFSIEKGIAGLKRLLHAHEMLEEDVAINHQQFLFNKTVWVRANNSGMFIWYQQSGAKVKTGELLGVINDPHGDVEIPVRASRDGYLIGHNNAPVVKAGDALFHIGYELEDL